MVAVKGLERRRIVRGRVINADATEWGITGAVYFFVPLIRHVPVLRRPSAPPIRFVYLFCVWCAPSCVPFHADGCTDKFTLCPRIRCLATSQGRLDAAAAREISSVDVPPFVVRARRIPLAGCEGAPYRKKTSPTM